MTSALTTTATAGTAIVTGAARGIGLAIARQLGHTGLSVAMWDVLDDVHGAAEALREDGIDAWAQHADMADETSVRAALAAVTARVDNLNVVVNNAGVSPKHNGFKRLLADTPLAEWDRVLRVNLTGPFTLCRESLPMLRQQPYGRIVNIASSVARFASPITGGPYSASKVGVITFSRILATELSGSAVTVNCVAPGRIVTPLTQQYDPSVDAEYIPRVPMRRLGAPEDIANAVRFLVSPEAASITGTVIDVNGGTFCN